MENIENIEYRKQKISKYRKIPAAANEKKMF